MGLCGSLTSRRQSGLNFVHDPGPLGNYFLPECMGSGAALFDFDGDGLLDIYLLQNGGPDSASKNRLFRQGPPGRFTDVSAGSGLDIAGHNMGVAIGDVNNDGRPDVLVTQYGGVQLFLNNGNGTFTDVTRQAGLDNPSWGTSACFFDYDRDGWLDLVVVNYVDYDPSRECLLRRPARLLSAPGFRRHAPQAVPQPWPRPPANEPAVRFEDVTEKSGLGRLQGRGLGVVCADFNGDGWPDIFVANDGMANHLWINRHDGTFRGRSGAARPGLQRPGPGRRQHGHRPGRRGRRRPARPVRHAPDRGDHTLWRQGPPGLFQDQTGPAGLANPHWRGTGFGTVLGDFDHDGALDLAVVNGRVRGRLRNRPPTRPLGRSGASTPSATSCSPTTAPAVFATSPATTRRSAAPPASRAAWPAATSTATARSTCW